MRKKILSLLVAIAIGISLLNVISSDSASAADTRIITCTSLKSGVIYLAKTGKCNARIYESSIWYKEGTAPSGTPGSKIISLTICRSKSKPESIILRIKCNARTQIATIWQRPLGPPAAPSIVTITAGVLGTATVETKAPTENGGARITSLTLSANPTSVVGKTARASSTYSPNSSGVIEISGLTPGASYVFTLIANNAVGASAPSQASASFLAPTVPGPATLSAVATTGTNSALITYAAPSFDGGSPITSYTATSSPGGIQATVYRSTTGTIEISGLAPSTTYTFTITANNFAGSSIPSTVSAPITTLTPPPATADAPAPSPTPTPTPTPTLATPAFTLTHTSETVIVDTAATGFTINSTGGTIASFAINATPAGMSFNTSTGALSGTPTSVAGATTYTITATNASGSASRTFALTVTAAKLTPTFSAWANLSKPAAGGDFVLKDPTVTGAIAGTFTYSSASTGVITLSSSTAHIVAAGTSVITATFTPTDTAAYFSASTTMTITVSSGDYIVGMDGPGGGKIFYVSTSTFACGPTLAATCKFLEVAPNTWSGGAADPSKIWAVVAKQSLDVSGITFDNAVNNTTSGIGLGYKNSIAIVTQGNDITTAAGAARAYSGGSKSDWYLPTSAELNQLCKWAGDLAWTSDATRCSGFTPVNGGFNSGKYYWSSSTQSEFQVWYQTFSSNQSYSAKSVANYVRPIRAFASTIISSRTLSIDSGYSSSYTMTATPPTLSATPSAGGGTKSYTSSTTGICTVGSSSGVVVFVSAGTCTISARILSDGDYEQVDSASISFTLSLASQTLTWAPTPAISMTETPKTPSSLASALGSPTITYSVTSAGATGCTVDSTTAVLTFTAAGSCTVRATSDATSVYESATQDVTFSINLATRTLSIDSGYSSSYTMTATPPTLSATPSARGGTKSYTSSTTGVCTIDTSSGVVAFVSAGTCTISAAIASDGTYEASTSSSISFSVTKTPTSLTIDSGSYTSSYTMTATPPRLTSTPSAGVGSKSYTSSTTGVCTIDTSSGVVAFVSAGTCTISAAIASDGTYAASTSSSISFSVTKTPTSLALFTNMNKTLGDSSFTLTRPSVSPNITGTFTYRSSDSLIASISESTATIFARGSTTITATFTPDDSTTYSSSTTTSILTVRQTPTFTWANVSKYVSDSDFTIAPPTASGGATGTYEYYSATTGVISLTGTSANAHVAGVGTSVITATFTPTDTTLYNVATTTMTITVSDVRGTTGPGGGTIFYYSSAGFSCGVSFASSCHYLEVAPLNWSGSGTEQQKAWAVNSYKTAYVDGIIEEGSSNFSNSRNGTDLPNYRSDEIGLGLKNSIAIVAQGNDTSTAAGASRAYAGGTLNDWYLPTMSELNQLCKYVSGQSWISDATLCTGSSDHLLGFAQDWYWSSSVSGATDSSLDPETNPQPFSWALYIYSRKQTIEYKYVPVFFRPIRSF